MAEPAFVQHILSSVRNELDLLKKYNYIQPKAYDEILRLLPNQATHGLAEALYDFTGENPTADLSFRRGDIIQIVDFVNDGWWKGSLNGRTGMFPSNYVRKIDQQQPPPPGPSPAIPARRTEKENYSMPNQSYPPPPQSANYSPNYSSQNAYAVPPPPQYAPPSNQYPPPPVVGVPMVPPPMAAPPMAAAPMAAAPAPAPAPQEESKLSGFGKQMAGNVANAATWGFGGTIGSQVAHSLF
ncbi:SH3 domain-containing protein [Sporodiniella umbellata]|nr:SH3 domain-containing protein [Sporodiniella umbellata]